MLISWQTKIIVLILAFFVGFWKGCEYKAGAHDLFVAKMEADSEKLLNGVLQRNALLKAKSDADAKERDKSYESKIASYRAAVKSGSVFKPCEGSGSTAPARTDGAGKPETAASWQGTVPTPRSVALGEPEVATVLGWYAYAETCNAWANFK